MKRRSTGTRRSGIAPYTRYNKTAFNYGAMYARNPGLRRPGQDGKTGQSGLGTLMREEDLERLKEVI
jgi:hypothetical protein